MPLGVVAVVSDTLFSELYVMRVFYFYFSQLIDHFTVVRLVAWPLNENEAGGDLVLIETSLLFLCKFVLISMRTTSLT